MTKKILCVHQGYELYGSDRSFISSLAVFRSAYPNYEIHVVIPKKGPLYDYLTAEGYQVFVRSIAKLSKKDIKQLRIKRLIQPLLSLRRIVREAKGYDLVYINTMVVLDYILASYFFNKKCLIHIREIPTGILGTISRLILKACGSSMIFNSKATRRVFDPNERPDHFLLYNGVKGYTTCQAPDFNGELRMLILGRLIPLKGQQFTLEAIGKYRDRLPKNLSLRIVGSAFEDQIEYAHHLKDLVKQYQLEKEVEFIEFVSNPEGQFEWSNVVLIPSIQPESFGRIAIEGMSASRPVIASDLGGLSEVVIHKQTGMLYHHENQEELIDAICYLDEDTNRMQQYGHDGFNRFCDHFTEDRYMANLKVILHQFLTE